MVLLHALTGWPVIIALLGLLVAWWFYIKSPETPKKFAQSLRGPYTLILHKYYADELYNAAIVQPLLWVSTNVLWQVVDEGLIDGTVNGVARVARESGAELREIQSGNARSYASWVVIGAVGVTLLMLGLWGMGR
jgi:NADH-quinone oxidoreductase subunit L